MSSTTGSSHATAAPSKDAPSLRHTIPIVCPGHTRPLAELQFLHLPQEDRTLLLSACHDKLPMLRDGTSGDWIGTLRGHKGAVWSATLDGSGSLAATGSGDFAAKLWDAVTGRELVTLTHGHIVKTCAFSPDSQYLATGGQEGTLRIFHLETVLQHVLPGAAANATEAITEAKWTIPMGDKDSAPTQRTAAISRLAWLNATTVLVGTSTGRIHVWSVPSATALAVDANHAMPAQPMATLDTQTGKEIRDMQVTTTSTTTHRTILTVATGNQVLFYDMTQAAPPFTLLHQHTMPINFDNEGGACLHPQGHVFLAGGSDLWVRMFDFDTGNILETFKGHHGPIRCLRIRPDGASFASGSEDGTIRLWDMPAVAAVISG